MAVVAALALGTSGVIGFAWANSRALARTADCCVDPTCPPGCSVICPPDCNLSGAPRAKSATPAAKATEIKAKSCPPCPLCP